MSKTIFDAIEEHGFILTKDDENVKTYSSSELLACEYFGEARCVITFSNSYESLVSIYFIKNGKHYGILERLGVVNSDYYFLKKTIVNLSRLTKSLTEKELE